MSEPVWNEAAECHAVHEELLAQFGGPSGVRDENLLDSALHRPRQLLQYESPSLFKIAAAYAVGVIKNHPFVDGNKRTGFIVAAWFLECNGLCFAAPEEEVVLHTLALAAGEEDEATYATWLESSCSKNT